MYAQENRERTMAYRATLRGVHIHLNIVDDDGRTAEAVVHLEQTGHLGVSKPYWTEAQTVAQLAMPLLEQAEETLTKRVNDDSEWK